MDAPEITLTAAKRTKVEAAKAKNHAAAATKRAVFAERYIVNGNNGREAAEFAGWSAKTAKVMASQLLKRQDVQELLGDRVQKALHDAQLSTERWAKEMACIAHFDPGEVYDEFGHLIPINELPEHVRRAISSVKDGDDGLEYKFWDKNVALGNVGKHLGVFERDNFQRTEGIKVLVQLLG